MCKLLWNLHVPTKVKHFRYQVCSRSLPTRENIGKRMTIDFLLCPFCVPCEAIDMNVLLDYKFTLEVWEVVGGGLVEI